MTRRRWAVRIGRIGDTEVWLDATWVPVLPLLGYSLAVAYFPENYPMFGAALDWLLGVAGAAGLLATVLLHEAAHLLVGRAPGAAVRSVTVGVLGCRPCAAHGQVRAPVVSVLSGPAASLLLGLAAFWGALNAGPVSRPLEAFLGYLSILNVLYAFLHCVPVVPFDAGTLLRMALVHMGVQPDVAARVLAALGVLAGCGCLTFGLWLLLVSRAGLLGVWVCVVGGLVLYTELALGWQRVPTGRTAPG